MFFHTNLLLNDNLLHIVMLLNDDEDNGLFTVVFTYPPDDKIATRLMSE